MPGCSWNGPINPPAAGLYGPATLGAPGRGGRRPSRCAADPGTDVDVAPMGDVGDAGDAH